MNTVPLRIVVEDRYPVQRGQRFSIRVEFDKALPDGTDIALQFEALDGTDGFEIGDHQRLGLGVPEYRAHGTAAGEAGVYRLSRITLNHPALATRVYTSVPDVVLTIVDNLPSFPELVAAERCLSHSDYARDGSQ